jgi:hypothetical protein
MIPYQLKQLLTSSKQYENTICALSEILSKHRQHAVLTINSVSLLGQEGGKMQRMRRLFVCLCVCERERERERENIQKVIFKLCEQKF